VSVTRCERPLTDAASPVILFEDSPATPAPENGRGKAVPPPVGTAPAAGTVSPTTPDGARGILERAGGDESDPSSPSAHDPAPEGLHPPGAGGLVEPSPVPARAAAAVSRSGGRGTPSSRSGRREGEAGPGVASPGPAMTSPPEQRGDGGARGHGTGGVTPASGSVPAEASAAVLRGRRGADRGRGPGGTDSAAGTSSPPGPGGAARVPVAAPPAPGPGLRGKAAMDAVRAAQGQQAKARRTGRGRGTARRAGDRYGPGMTRRMPPPGGDS
jgi:hypothetical protein